MATKIAFEENHANPFTKSLLERVFDKQVNCMGLMSVLDLL